MSKKEYFGNFWTEYGYLSQLEAEIDSQLKAAVDLFILWYQREPDFSNELDMLTIEGILAVMFSNKFSLKNVLD